MSEKEGNKPVHKDATAGVIVLVVYFISFFLPAQVTVGGEFHGTTWGLGAFLLALLPPYTLVWLANPALWLGAFWMARGKWKRARIAAVVAVLCAGAMMLTPNGGAGSDRLLIGYYVWFLSTIILAIAAANGFVADRLEREGKLTPEIRQFHRWLPRAMLLIVLVPVACFLFSTSARIGAIDYFVTNCGNEADSAIKPFLSDPSSKVRMYAAEKLSSLPGHGGDPAISSVVSAEMTENLKSDYAQKRIAALDFLRTHDGPDIWGTSVVKLLQDRDANVRLATAQLIKAKPNYATQYKNAMNDSDIDAVLRAAMKDPDEQVRLIIAQFSAQRGDGTGKAAADVLSASLHSTNESVRASAKEGIVTLGARPDAPAAALLAALKETNVTIHVAVAKKIAADAKRFERKAHGYVPVLNELKNDPDATVRREVEAALDAVTVFKLTADAVPFVGTWRTEGDDMPGRHVVEVDALKDDGAWDHWRRTVTWQTNGVRGADASVKRVNVFTNQFHYSGTWYAEDHALHKQAPEGRAGSYGKISTIEPNRFVVESVIIGKQRTVEYERVTTDADAVGKLLLSTVHE